MEVSLLIDTPASQELSSNSESVTTPNIQTHYTLGDFSMNDLKMCLNEFKSVEPSGLPAGKNRKCGKAMEDDCKDDSDESGNSLPESTSSFEGFFGEGWDDCNPLEGNGCNKFIDQCHSPPKIPSLASAMKGSREKQGVPPKKLSVTWAPDVYDPIPTSVSHVPSNKNQYRKNSKKWKNKQSGGGGKSPREGKGRGKRQARKNGGNNTTNFKPAHGDMPTIASFSEPKSDYNVVSTDPFCGSSFLKESIKNAHFPVAEASR